MDLEVGPSSALLIIWFKYFQKKSYFLLTLFLFALAKGHKVMEIIFFLVDLKDTDEAKDDFLFMMNY